jgi:hypothetical protein
MTAEDFTAEDVISKDAEITPVSQSSQRFFIFPFSLRRGKGEINQRCTACSAFHAASVY